MLSAWVWFQAHFEGLLCYVELSLALLRDGPRSQTKNSVTDACLCLKHLAASVPIVEANV